MSVYELVIAGNIKLTVGAAIVISAFINTKLFRIIVQKLSLELQRHANLQYSYEINNV